MRYDYFFYMTPSLWNKYKFHIRMDENICLFGEYPKYVEDFLKALNVTILQFDDLEDTNLEERFFDPPPSSKIEMIDDIEMHIVDFDVMKSESWDDIVDEKTCYIECQPYNFCTTLYGLRKFKYKTWVRNLIELGYEFKPLFWEDMISRLSEAQITLISSFKDDIVLAKIENFDKFQTRISAFPDSEDKIEESKYIHIISDGNQIVPIYRRFFLNKYLDERYGEDLKTNSFLGIGVSDVCVVSHPSNILPSAKKYFFDRTDNWSAISEERKEVEDEILKVADYVTCSSKFLIEDTKRWMKENRPNDNIPIKYIPNGNVWFDYPKDIEKFEKRTAIYVGNHLSKTDLQLLFLLCEMNPDWNFMLYADEAEDLKSIPDNLFVHSMIPIEDLFPVICKCHLGLILLRKSTWSAGMLPNKTFNYINAHLPIVYSGLYEKNLEDYKDVCFNISDIESLDSVVDKNIDDETFDKYKRDWSDVCKEIFDCIKELK